LQLKDSGDPLEEIAALHVEVGVSGIGIIILDVELPLEQHTYQLISFSVVVKFLQPVVTVKEIVDCLETKPPDPCQQ
jgi:hypothetical protein